jgi:lipopolysaccharide exporter
MRVDAAQVASRSAHALTWSWAGALARALVQLVVQILLARLLGPQAYGQAAAALLVVGLCWLLAEAGLGAALVQRDGLQDQHVGAALGWVLSLSALMAVLLVLLAPWLAVWLGGAGSAGGAAGAGPAVDALGSQASAAAATATATATATVDGGLYGLILFCAVLVPLQALSNLPINLMQRRFDAKRLQAVQLGAYVLAYAGVGLLLAVHGAGAISVLAAFAANAALCGIGAWFFVRHTLRPRWAGGRELLRYGAGVTLANLSNWAIESVDRAMVSRYWGAAPLGAYTVASTLARAPAMLFVGAAQPVAFAASARVQDEVARLQRGYLAMLSLALLLCLPVFVWLAWHAAPVVALLYGDAWSHAAGPFAWLCLAVPPFVMLALTGPVLRGVDALQAETRWQWLLLLLLVLGLWACVGQPLAWAAAVVFGVTWLRAALFYGALASRIQLPPWAWWRPWRGGALLCLPVLALAWVVPQVQRLSGLAPQPGAWPWLLLSMLLGAAAVLTLLRHWGPSLLGAELVLALGNRQTDSRLAALLARWCRLQPRMAPRAAIEGHAP